MMKKKFLPLIVSLVVVAVCLFLLPTQAEAAGVDDLTFTLNSDGETLEDGYMWVNNEAKKLYQGSSATLGNSLAINFVVDSSLLTGSNNFAVIIKSYADGRENAVAIIPQSQWETFSGSWLYFTFDGIAAKEMTDTFTVKIFNSNADCISSWSDTLQDYLMRVTENELKKTDPDVSKVRLYVDALIYGAAAQTKFTYSLDNMADAKLTDSLLAYATQDSALDGLKNIQVKPEGMLGSSLVLKDKITLNFVFSNAAMANCKYVKVSFTDHYGNLQEEILQAAELLNYSTLGKLVPAAQMAVADCSAKVTVTLYDSNNNVMLTAVDSVESYIARQLASDRALFGSIMKFSMAAYNTFHPTSNDHPLGYGNWQAVLPKFTTAETISVLYLHFGENSGEGGTMLYGYKDVATLDPAQVEEMREYGVHFMVYEGKEYVRYTGAGDPMHYTVDGDTVTIYPGEAGDESPYYLTLQKAAGNQAVVTAQNGYTYYEITPGMVFTYAD